MRHAHRANRVGSATRSLRGSCPSCFPSGQCNMQRTDCILLVKVVGCDELECFHVTTVQIVSTTHNNNNNNNNSFQCQPISHCIVLCNCFHTVQPCKERVMQCVSLVTFRYHIRACTCTTTSMCICAYCSHRWLINHAHHITPHHTEQGSHISVISQDCHPITPVCLFCLF